MPNIQGQKKWSEIRLLETHELARGGVNGNLNEQAIALADRTEFLNQEKADKSEIIQGVFEFGTYAEFNAAKADLPLNCTVVIGEENTTGTGTWDIGNNSWNGSVLKKSGFDPYEKSKKYTDANFGKGRSVISTGATLFNYQQNGSYFGAANTTLTDAPVDRDAAKDFIFSVESIIDTDRYKQQTYKETGTGKIWIRTIDLQNNVIRRDWAHAQVDDASVTTAKLANKAASRPKLSDNFLFNEVLTTGLISDACKDGLYFGTAQNHTDIPSSGLNSANSFILEVKDMTGLGRFIYQKLTRYAALDREWWRIVDTQNPSAAVWTRTYSLVDAAVTTALIAGKAVTGEKLADNYRYKALINSGSTRDIVADGTYLVVAATTADNPPQITGNYLLIVENISSSSYVNQRAIQLSDGSKTATRTIRPAQNIYYDWKAPDAGQVNPFAGKKIAFLGDSITEFGTYPQQVANALGATALNMGIGGTRLGFHSLPNYDELSGYKIAKAINTGNFTPLETAAAGLIVSDNDDNTAAVNLIKTTDWSTVDYLVVGYGTNDFGGNRPVGIYTENLSDGSTFAGAANYFIQMIHSKYPQIKIVFTTPIWRKKTPMAQAGIDGGSDVSPNTLGKYLIEYADELIKVAQSNHIEVLDLYRKSGISKYTEKLYLNQSDMLHPLNPGYELIANKVAGFLKASF